MKPQDLDVLQMINKSIESKQIQTKQIDKNCLKDFQDQCQAAQDIVIFDSTFTVCQVTKTQWMSDLYHEYEMFGINHLPDRMNVDMVYKLFGILVEDKVGGDIIYLHIFAPHINSETILYHGAKISFIYIYLNPSRGFRKLQRNDNIRSLDLLYNVEIRDTNNLTMDIQLQIIKNIFYNLFWYQLQNQEQSNQEQSKFIASVYEHDIPIIDEISNLIDLMDTEPFYCKEIYNKFKPDLFTEETDYVRSTPHPNTSKKKMEIAEDKYFQVVDHWGDLQLQLQLNPEKEQKTIQVQQWQSQMSDFAFKCNYSRQYKKVDKEFQISIIKGKKIVLTYLNMTYECEHEHDDLTKANEFFIFHAPDSWNIKFLHTFSQSGIFYHMVKLKVIRKGDDRQCLILLTSVGDKVVDLTFEVNNGEYIQPIKMIQNQWYLDDDYIPHIHMFITSKYTLN